MKEQMTDPAATSSTDILLIGGGVAAAQAAVTLRQEGFSGSILLASRESDAPYRRPPLTKSYLLGRSTRNDATVRPSNWWSEADVTLATRTSVIDMDASQGLASLSTKEVVKFDQALIATGAMVRRLTIEGAALEGIHYLRAPRNADRLLEDLTDAKHVVCIGGSYIASEVAASLTSLGHQVTMVMVEDEPLSRQFGSDVGRFFRGILGGHGIEILGGEEAATFAGQSGRVEAVITKSGRWIPADVVVCGVGAVPDVTLARKAGVTLGPSGGVLCDSHLRSSAPNVFAAGDVCEYQSVVHDRTVRIEHEAVAETQGSTAARNMLGRGEVYEAVPYFFSDLSDWASLEYVGPAYEWDEEVVVGDPASGAFAVWYLHDGLVRGMLSVGGHGDLESARNSIGLPVPPG